MPGRILFLFGLLGLREDLMPLDQISIAMLLSSIMCARSPATAVAMIQVEIGSCSFLASAQELGMATDSSRLMMGLTVVSDIAVLISFGVSSTVASSTCPATTGRRPLRRYHANLLQGAKLMVLTSLHLCSSSCNCSYACWWGLCAIAAPIFRTGRVGARASVEVVAVAAHSAHSSDSLGRQPH
jgi:hypothetical protein